jgi:hypothetical protein
MERPASLIENAAGLDEVVETFAFEETSHRQELDRVAGGSLGRGFEKLEIEAVIAHPYFVPCRGMEGLQIPLVVGGTS